MKKIGIIASAILAISMLFTACPSPAGSDAGTGGSGGTTGGGIQIIFYSDNPSATGVQRIVQTTSEEYVKLRKNTFSKEGYVFSHWEHRYSSYSTKAKFDGDTVLSKEFEPYKDMWGDEKESYLQAVWVKAENAQKVTLCKNDEISNESITFYRDTSSTFFDLCEYFNERYTRNGYKLAGLSNTPDATYAFYKDWRDNDKLGTADLILYGIWKNDNWIVIYHANYEGAPEETIIKEYPSATSSELEVLHPFSREGYMFRGYTTSRSYDTIIYPDNTTFYFYGNAKNEYHMYAQWLKNDDIYTVIYHSNTESDETYTQYVGNFESSEQGYFNGVEYLGYVRSRIQFTKEDWESDTWNTKADLTGSQYSDYDGPGEYTTRFTKEMFDSSKVLHLYVEWSYTKVLVKYVSADSNAKTDDDKSIYYEYTGKDRSQYNSIFFLPNMFTKNIRDGYKFKCWEYKSKEYNAGDPFPETLWNAESLEQEVRAKWEPINP